MLLNEQVLNNTYHIQLVSQGQDGSLPAGRQLLKVLVAKFLPSATFPGALPAAF